MSCCPDPVKMQGGALEAVVREGELSAATHDLFDGRMEGDFLVPDMKCAACIRTLERGLQNAPGILSARANLTQKRLNVVWQQELTDTGSVGRNIESLGYTVMPFETAALTDEKDPAGQSLLTSLAVAGFAAANVMLLSVSVWAGADHETAQLFHLISGCIAVPAVLFAGRPFFRPAIDALSKGRLNMDVPISLAVILALLFSTFETLSGGDRAYFDAAVTLIFFLLIGRYLDHLMRRRARGAASRLASLAARGGLKIMPDDSVAYIPVSEILAGMRLRVPAGERFPVDSEILYGAASVDRSFVTGESDPVLLQAGAVAEAGTLNLDRPVDVRAHRTAKSSFLADMIRLMASAEESKGAFVSLADRLASIYAPVVHILAFAAFVFWMTVTGGDWYVSLYSAIAVLIITCPCALGLAVPIVHVVAATRLFDDGILMKDGTALERLADVRTAFFDKTGTLTTGSPEVTGMNGDVSRPDIALALSRQSRHPFSGGVEAYLQARPDLNARAKAVVLSGSVEVPGCGVEGRVDGKRYRLGRGAWVQELSGNSAGKAAMDDDVCFGGEGVPCVSFPVSETLRAGAEDTVARVRETGITPAIISGDRPARVERIADRLAVDERHSGLTPAEKLRMISAAEERGEKCLVVGDGLNDSAALAAGSVSMAPGSATDVSRLAADFVFTRESLRAVDLTLKVARTARWLVCENFALALLYNCIAIPAAFFGYVTPLTAAIAMSASSIVVIANSLRLRWLVPGRVSGMAKPPERVVQ